MEKEKRPEAKPDQSHPAKKKKGLQNSTRGPKKSRMARESYVYLTNDITDSVAWTSLNDPAPYIELN